MGKELVELVNYDFKSQLLEDRKEKIERRNKMRTFNEEFYTEGRPEWIINLYLKLDRFITASLKVQVRKDYLETYIKYSYNGLLFCHISISKGETLKLWAKIPYLSLGAVPLFVRDYQPVNRRVGVMVTFDNQRDFLQNEEAMLDVTFGIILKAFKGISSQKRRKVKTPLKRVEEVEPLILESIEAEPLKPVKIVKPSAINISVEDNGYLSINLKLHKSQKEILNRILQETIFK
ncbi:hypothetical protein ES695_11480 [Candidatus Atribacteria bacterium 1244-E10-H5-B2]|nr:MAG: hypothetical protein ES695_11480 [Candidatus Atribacteria bacterium 1244-E10-H5-B2]